MKDAGSECDVRHPAFRRMSEYVSSTTEGLNDTLASMVEPELRPPAWRVALAFLLAPAVAAFLYACLLPLYAGVPSLVDRVWRTFPFYFVFGALPATLIFGVPAFFVLKSRVKATPLNCALVGAAIAALPWLVLGLLISPNYAYSNGHVTHDHGVITWLGFLDLSAGVAELAALGLLAGFVFWVTAASGARSAT